MAISISLQVSIANLQLTIAGVVYYPLIEPLALTHENSPYILQNWLIKKSVVYN